MKKIKNILKFIVLLLPIIALAVMCCISIASAKNSGSIPQSSEVISICEDVYEDVADKIHSVLPAPIVSIYNWFNTNIFNNHLANSAYIRLSIDYCLYYVIMQMLFLICEAFLFFINMGQHFLER